jgi:hypothetical protein
MCFFKHSSRVRIRSIRVDGLEYRGGRVVAPLVDPETGCTSAEMSDTLVRRPIAVKPVKLSTPELADPNQEVDQEVA